LFLAISLQNWLLFLVGGDLLRQEVLLHLLGQVQRPRQDGRVAGVGSRPSQLVCQCCPILGPVTGLRGRSTSIDSLQ
jgi:hypothetical protein